MQINIAAKELEGKTITNLTADDKSFTIETDDYSYCFYHERDCCENVYLEDSGDIPLSEFIGQNVYSLEFVESNDQAFPNHSTSGWLDVIKYTFMKLTCSKNDVTFRWCGTSNGYYSMSPNAVEKRRKY